jgi:hypothetical protein
MLLAGNAGAVEQKGESIESLIQKGCGDTYLDAGSYQQCKLRVLADKLRDLQQKSRRLQIDQLSLEWLVRFSIDDKDPDKDIKFEVARRKGILFATILERCLSESTPDAIAFEDKPEQMQIPALARAFTTLLPVSPKPDFVPVYAAAGAAFFNPGRSCHPGLPTVIQPATGLAVL